VSIDQGIFYIVATPIGNLKDITLRAIEVLSQVEIIAAEDTRVTRQLLSHYAIKTKCIPVHEHNEQKVADRLMRQLARGSSIALVTDAGTPLLSDPGYHMVAAAYKSGIRVVPIPGPDSATCALVVSGLPVDRYCFEGFLPASSGARRKRLLELAAENRTMIFFEAPRRLSDCLTDMRQIFGAERRAALAREMTKLHEQVISSTVADLLQNFEQDPQLVRGESVLIVAGKPTDRLEQQRQHAVHTLTVLLQYLPLKQAVSAARQITGAPKNSLYQLALTLGNHGPTLQDRGKG
jgi:16S rRNA (cytidine1402-2'-O)-methyltransferase